MIRLTILGCGSSGGVPRIGGHWGDCDPANPKNRRRRCSVLIDRIGPDGITRALIDTGPDLVAQMLDAGVVTIDAVVWTHAHADHLHGIDDLRQMAFNAGRILQGHADRPTTEALLTRFAYIFETPPGSFYPPICVLNAIRGPFEIDGAGGPVQVTPFVVNHGSIDALGLKIATAGGGIVYLPDVLNIDAAGWDIIGEPEVFICDALRRKPHSSHAHLDLAVEWINRSGAPRGVLTNMHLDMDYEAVMRDTPAHIIPAFDGMVIEAAA